MTHLNTLKDDIATLEAKARVILEELDLSSELDRKRLNILQGKLIAYKHIIHLINDLTKKA